MSPVLSYRANVAALVLVGDEGLLACERSSGGIWQTVQGGIESEDENLEAGILRELREELGIESQAVTLISRSKSWRRYRFPEEVILQRASANRPHEHAGQEQMWFLARIGSLADVRLDLADGEFRSVKIVSAAKLAAAFVPWKRPVVLDFCQEVGLLP